MVQSMDKEKVSLQETSFGKIPKDWILSPISDFLLKLKGGAPLKPSDFVSQGERVLPKAGIVPGGILRIEAHKQQYCSKEYLKRHHNNVVNKSYIIVVLRDLVPSGPSIGLMVKINSQNQYLLAQGTYGLLIDKEKVAPNYLIQLSNSSSYRKAVQNIMVGSTQVHITNSSFKKLQIPLPPTLSEQTAIANALSDMDALIDAQEKLIHKKRLIKRGAMQELLKPKEGWVETTIGDCAHIIGGGTPSSFNPNFWNGNINWFTPTEIGTEKYVNSSNRKITAEGLKNSSAKILPVGTILLTTRAGIGDLSILKCEASTNQGFQSLLAKNNTDNEFLYYLTATLKNKLIQNASGSTFLEISPGKIRSLKINVPPKNTQTNIAQILSDMDTEIEQLETQLTKYKQMKAGMMQELLTGKKRLI